MCVILLVTMMKRAPSKTSASKSQLPLAVEDASNATRFIPIIIGVLLIVIVGYALTQTSFLSKKMSTSSQLSQKEIQQLIDRVSAVVQVKTDETPSVATITDISIMKANNPILYRDAQNGDRMLVWTDKAVIYSTTQDKVISVMPMVTSKDDVAYLQRLVTSLTGAPTAVAPVATTTTSTTGGEVITKPTIEVRNGTPTPGKARTLVDQLKTSYQVLAPADANKKDYTKTVVYIRDPKVAVDVAQRIASSINATLVTELPGEQNLRGEVVVVIGQ